MLIVGICSLFVRMYHIDTVSIWYDEAFSYELAARMSWYEMLEALRKDVHPPFYFASLKIWAAAIGSSIQSLRLFSVLAGILATIGIYLFTRDAFRFDSDDEETLQKSRAAGVTAAAMLAFMSAHIQWSQEAKAYAFATALISFCSWFLLRALSPTSRRVRFWWVAWVLSADASLYTHNYAIFTVFGQCVFLMIYFFREASESLKLGQISVSLICPVASIVALAVGFLPWVPTLVEQSRRVKADYWITAASSSIPMNLDLLLFPSITGISDKDRAFIAASVILLIMIWLLWQRRGECGLVATLIASPLVCAAIFSSTVAPIITPRYFLFSVMFLPTSIALIIWRQRTPVVRWGVSACLILNTAYFGIDFVESLSLPERAGTRGATEFALANLKPNQPLVVLNAGIYFSVQYYTEENVTPVWLASGRTLPHYLCGSISSRIKQISVDDLDALPANNICVIDSTGFSMVSAAHGSLSDVWEEDEKPAMNFQELYGWQGITSVTTYHRKAASKDMSLKKEVRDENVGP